MSDYGTFAKQFLNLVVQLTGRQPSVQTVHLIHENSLQGGQPLKRMIFKRGSYDGDFETNDDETVIESGAVMKGYLKASKVIIQAGGKFIGTMLVDELDNHGYCKAENSLIGKLKVSTGATIDGDITFASLEIEPGAIVQSALYPEGSEFSADINSVMIASVMDRGSTGSFREDPMESDEALDGTDKQKEKSGSDKVPFEGDPEMQEAVEQGAREYESSREKDLEMFGPMPSSKTPSDPEETT